MRVRVCGEGRPPPWALLQTLPHLVKPLQSGSSQWPCGILLYDIHPSVVNQVKVVTSGDIVIK